MTDIILFADLTPEQQNDLKTAYDLGLEVERFHAEFKIWDLLEKGSFYKHIAYRLSKNQTLLLNEEKTGFKDLRYDKREALRHAHKMGLKIQYWHFVEKDWINSVDPGWYEETVYRIAPIQEQITDSEAKREDKIINNADRIVALHGLKKRTEELKFDLQRYDETDGRDENHLSSRSSNILDTLEELIDKRIDCIAIEQGRKWAADPQELDHDC